MTDGNPMAGDGRDNEAPGPDDQQHQEPMAAVRGYVIGLVAAALLTIASFGVAGSGLVWGPGIPVALVALAIGQMGVHLVFFLHVTTGPDNTNNVLALAFGLLIVALVLIGTLWIMSNLNAHMQLMGDMMRMQR